MLILRVRTDAFSHGRCPSAWDVHELDRQALSFMEPELQRGRGREAENGMCQYFEVGTSHQAEKDTREKP